MAQVNVKNALQFLKPMTVIIILAVVVALILMGTSVFMVDQTERGVVTTFGKFSYVAEPGLHFMLPFGIQKNYNVPTEVVQVEQFGFRTEKSGVVSQYDTSYKPITMLTGDLNIVQIEWIVQYKIVDARAWQFNVYDKHKTIRDISQSVVNQLVGDSSFAEITTSARVRLEGEGLEMMNAMFKSFGLGINVIAVKFQNVEMPEAVKAAFSDVSNAKTDLIRMVNEGKESYNAVIPKAQGEADKILNQAEGYATERVNDAQGEVARFNAVYEEYRKAPEITRERLYYEMMEAVFGAESNVTLIDKNLDNYLPIQNMQKTVSAARAAQGASE
jgi:modulator of FtsH protease HflK